MYLLALAASFMAPEPLFQDSWISPYLDFPRTGLKTESWTTMLIELTVDTQGNAARCNARVIEGNPNMGRYTCARLRDRSRFHPARDEAGNKIYGVFRTSVGWWNGKSPPPKAETPAHFRASIAQLPAAAPSPATVRIKFLVDEAGRLSGCAAVDRDSEHSENAEAEAETEAMKASLLAPLACAQMTRLPSIEPARSRGGKPLKSVQTATVRLERRD